MNINRACSVPELVKCLSIYILYAESDFCKSSWTTARIFEKCIVNLNKHMAKECSKIFTFIDSCPAHIKSTENNCFLST